MRLGPPPAEPEIPGQFWIDFIRDTAPVFRKPTIEQLGEFIAPTFQALIDGAKYVDAAARSRSSTSSAPDVIVEDNVVAFPALGGVRPAVGPDRVVQPGRDQGPGDRRRSRRAIPRRTDRLAGVPRGGRADPRRHVGRLRRVLPRARRAAASSWGDARARTSSPSRRGSTSTRTRVEADYARERAARAHVAPARLDGPGGRRRPGSCPTTCASGDGALIYLSLGVLGSADVGLMQRLVDLLGHDASTGSSSRRARWPTRSRSTTTRPARGSCPSRRSCRRSTSSSRTAATTPSPRRSTTASR